MAEYNEGACINFNNHRRKKHESVHIASFNKFHHLNKRGFINETKFRRYCESK